MKRLKNSKEAASLRNELLKKQKGLDPIIGVKITKPVLDHQHYNNQHCREVLQNEVNALEGKIVNAIKRCVSHLTDMPSYEILRNIADYIERNEKTPQSEQIIHHTALTIDVRRFKAMPATLQNKILKDYGVEPESNVKKRCNQARKLIKDGKLDIKKYRTK